LPESTVGIIEETSKNRKMEERHEIPSRIFSCFPINMTPKVPIRGTRRVMRSFAELTVVISMTDVPFPNL
jgi:hypothetical protein